VRPAVRNDVARIRAVAGRDSLADYLGTGGRLRAQRGTPRPGKPSCRPLPAAPIARSSAAPLAARR